MGRGQPAREELDARRQAYPVEELRLTPEGVLDSIEQIDPEKVCSMSTIGGVMVRRIFRGDMERIKKYLLPHLQAHLDGRLSATSRELFNTLRGVLIPKDSDKDGVRIVGVPCCMSRLHIGDPISRLRKT